MIAAVANHAAFNTVSRFLAGLFAETQPRASIPFELVLGLSGLAVGLSLSLATKGRLGYCASNHADTPPKPAAPE